MPIYWFQGGTITLDSTKESAASGSINVWTVLKKGSRERNVEKEYDLDILEVMFMENLEKCERR